ncbi:hypothetical protein G7Y89_g9126 [Cudoniella acicularis]|uniref:Uncharacterized protein n=1 Tax=Cudoniella acicularis TaxID=354080 RepID=A0A8H4RHW7_9HELO|nr:hypothetical protein G7Y89_g9126 [Cudoniella acicularis]
MQSTDYEIPPFEQHMFDNYHYELDFSTPDRHSFAGDPPEEGRQPTPQSSDKESSSVFNYTIVWKLQLRKGRITSLTEDTIEDVDVAPGAYWRLLNIKPSVSKMTLRTALSTTPPP